MRPYVVVFLEIGGEVFGLWGGRERIIPEIDGHVGECGGRDQLSWYTVFDWDAGNPAAAFDEGVVDCYGCSETWSLGAADVDGR